MVIIGIDFYGEISENLSFDRFSKGSK